MKAQRILHYPGSKWSLAEWIISHMPAHTTYLEPYFGSGAVLFNKTPSTLETINDTSGEVVNLFRVVRDSPHELSKVVSLTPYSRQEYIESHDKAIDDIERARRFLVRCWQSIRVKTGSISGWKCRGTADDSYRIKQWNDLPEKFIAVAERLKQVQIENRPAVEVIKRYNRSDVLIYADPPYLESTRNGAIYEDEMTIGDHEVLLQELAKHEGPVLLSAYQNELYTDLLQGWEYQTRQQVIENGTHRTEVLWINPIAAEHSRQLTLF